MWPCWWSTCRAFTTPWVSLPALDKLEMQYMPVIPEPVGRGRRIRSPRPSLPILEYRIFCLKIHKHISPNAKGNKNATYMQ